MKRSKRKECVIINLGVREKFPCFGRIKTKPNLLLEKNEKNVDILKTLERTVNGIFLGRGIGTNETNIKLGQNRWTYTTIILKVVNKIATKVLGLW